MAEVRIADTRGGVLAVSFSDIAHVVESEAQDLKWSILFLDGHGNLGADRSVPELCSEIWTSANGLMLSWQETKELLGKFEQIYDLTLIGSHNELALRRYESESEMLGCCEMVIESEDCSWWSVFTPDRGLVDALAGSFDEIKATGRFPSAFRELGIELPSGREAVLEVAHQFSRRMLSGQLDYEDGIEALAHLSFENSADQLVDFLAFNLLERELRRIRHEQDPVAQSAQKEDWAISVLNTLAKFEFG